MKIILWVVGALVLLTLGLVLLKKKRRKNSLIEKSQKHPSGLALYHKHTKVKMRPALEGGKNNSKVAVIDFKGDLRASKRFDLSRLFDEIFFNKDELTELVLKVESPGGGVAEYGFLYAELERLRVRCSALTITVCVDTVAASGGYLMSLPAHKIYAAPFAMVGSIGVVSFIPNIRKLLEKFNIQPRTFTAGDYKRTVTLTDDASPEDVEHYKQQLALIHAQFKMALTKYRTHVKVDQVATGEAWLASTTLEKELGLVDELRVSSDYLMELNSKNDLVFLSYEKEKESLISRFRKVAMEVVWELRSTFSS